MRVILPLTILCLLMSGCGDGEAQDASGVVEPTAVAEAAVEAVATDTVAPATDEPIRVTEPPEEPTEPPAPTEQPAATEPPPPTDVPDLAVGRLRIGVTFYDGDVPDTEDDEYIEIINDGAPTSPAGWTLRETDDNTYYFPDSTMDTGQACRVYTNELHPESCGFNWGSAKPVWGNKGDAATLVDPSGEVVSQNGW